MTLQNAERLLKHYQNLADGTIPQPLGHKDWADVVANAKVRAADMKKRVEWYNSDGFRAKHNLPESEESIAKRKKAEAKAKKEAEAKAKAEAAGAE